MLPSAFWFEASARGGLVVLPRSTGLADGKETLLGCRCGVDAGIGECSGTEGGLLDEGCCRLEMEVIVVEGRGRLV